MIKRQDQRERCIELLAAHMLAHGLGQTSLRQLADAAGVSNRMLLYYFDDKADILTAVLGKVASDLQMHLTRAIPAGVKLPPKDVLRDCATVLLDEDMRPYMQLSIEVIAASGRGVAPFANLAPGLFAGFLSWIEAHLATKNTAKRKAEAAMILAMIDGLTVLILGGKAAEAEAALTRLVAAL
jgi:AcrR family transcriptional regulator